MIPQNAEEDSMRRIWLGAGLAGILAFCALTARGQDTGAQALDAAWIKAMKTNDVEAAAACYAADAALWLPGAAEARGAKAIHDAYAGLLGEMSVENVVIADAVYESSGDWSSGWGHFTLTLRPKKGGDRIVMQGRFTEVAKRVGDRWFYVADHASNDPPASAKP
jgi:ketosteroid isomerase-like protein